jgi:acetolactate synthase-1/3 small subunit
METKKYKVIELTVQNHSGVMSHITGLFSRRGYNLEGILCGRIGDGSLSKMYLLVEHNDQFEQVVKQLSKLHDVSSLSIKEDADTSVFTNLEKMFAS